jgi:hypothetical protein
MFCTLTQEDWLYLGQTITLTAKLTSLKYQLSMANVDRDIRFLRYSQFWYGNMIIWELISSIFYTIIMFSKQRVFRIFLKFIHHNRFNFSESLLRSIKLGKILAIIYQISEVIISNFDLILYERNELYKRIFQ